MVDTDYYTHPVTLLLKHGPIRSSATGKWFDYVGNYGLGEIDVPELISLAQGVEIDWNDPQQHDAPIHACRALGQLGDAAADSYLVRLLDDDENTGVTESVLVALSMLGSRSLAVLKQYFEQPETSPWSQALAAEGIAVFAKKYPDFRDECIEFLAQALAQHSQNAPELNGFLIQNLAKLQATEAVGEIKAAFQSGLVEGGISDTWANVQIALGLATEADFTEAELSGMTLAEVVAQKSPSSDFPKG